MGQSRCTAAHPVSAATEADRCCESTERAVVSLIIPIAGAESPKIGRRLYQHDPIVSVRPSYPVPGDIGGSQGESRQRIDRCGAVFAGA